MNQLSPDAYPRQESLAQSKELFFDTMIDWGLRADGTNDLAPIIIWSEQIQSQLDFSTLDPNSQNVLQEILNGLQQQFQSRLESAGVIKTVESTEKSLVSRAAGILRKVRQVFQRDQKILTKDEISQETFDVIQAEFDQITTQFRMLSPWFDSDGQGIKIKKEGKTTQLNPRGVLWKPVREVDKRAPSRADKKEIEAKIKTKEERDALKRELIELARKIKDGESSLEDDDVRAELARLRSEYILPSSHKEIHDEHEKAALQIPRYIVGNELGIGGAASVSVVFDMVKGDFFAAKKVALPKGDPDTDFMHGILSSEAKILAALRDTPGLEAITPQVYDIFLTDDQELVMIMEYFPNYKEPTTILRELGIENKDIQTPEQQARKRSFAKNFMVSSGSALDKLRPIVLHNDVKPANFLANENGDVQVIDFGMASTIDASGHGLFGTPLYMSPDRTLETSVRDKPKVELLNDCFALSGMFFGLIAEKRLLPKDYGVWDLLASFANMQKKPGSSEWVTISQNLEQALINLGLDQSEAQETVQIAGAGFDIAGSNFRWESTEEFTRDLVKYF